MIDFKRLAGTDKILISVILLLSFAGLIALHSIQTADANAKDFFNRQLIWVLLGSIAFVTATIINMDFFFRTSMLWYILSLIFLVLVKIKGVSGYGATRWIAIGPFNFQPSEMAKLTTLLFLSRYYVYERKNPNHPLNFLWSATIVGIPMILTLIQPDLGTSLVFAVMLLPILHWAGLNWVFLFCLFSLILVIVASFHLVAFFIIVTLSLMMLYASKQKNVLLLLMFVGYMLVGLATPVLWGSLKPYQQARIKVFLSPENDPKGAGYQIIQSKVAIGSGGLLGKGWHKGTQVRYGFLPERHNDFIFSVIGEEFGFAGSSMILVLYAILLLRILYIATRVKYRQNVLFVVGVFIILAFHFVVNVGMTIGLMPVTGLPLPFMSYGGTGMIINFTLAGIVNNIWSSRFE